MSDIFRGRRSLLWLAGPAVVFLVPLPFVNHPYVLGPWLFGATLLTPVFVLLAARHDPLFHDDGDVDSERRSDGDTGQVDETR